MSYINNVFIPSYWLLNKNRIQHFSLFTCCVYLITHEFFLFVCLTLVKKLILITCSAQNKELVEFSVKIWWSSEIVCIHCYWCVSLAYEGETFFLYLSFTSAAHISHQSTMTSTYQHQLQKTQIIYVLQTLRKEKESIKIFVCILLACVQEASPTVLPPLRGRGEGLLASHPGWYWQLWGRTRGSRETDPHRRETRQPWRYIFPSLEQNNLFY